MLSSARPTGGVVVDVVEKRRLTEGVEAKAEATGRERMEEEEEEEERAPLAIARWCWCFDRLFIDVVIDVDTNLLIEGLKWDAKTREHDVQIMAEW